MINTTLTLLAEKLNAHLKSTFQLEEDKAIASNLIHTDGSIPSEISNKVVICLANIEQESSLSNLGFANNKPLDIKHISLNLNLNVLIVANFTNYHESLKYISTTIVYFQTNPVILNQTNPELTDTIDKLTIEMMKADANTTSQIWHAMGAKYSPSVIYKIRLLSNHK